MVLVMGTFSNMGQFAISNYCMVILVLGRYGMIRGEVVENENSPYENLANAIIIQAALEYKHTLNKIKRGTVPKYENQYDASLRGLRIFFHSEYFKSLTNIEGDVILEGLDNTVK